MRFQFDPAADDGFLARGGGISDWRPGRPGIFRAEHDRFREVISSGMEPDRDRSGAFRFQGANRPLRGNEGPERTAAVPGFASSPVGLTCNSAARTDKLVAGMAAIATAARKNDLVR